MFKKLSIFSIIFVALITGCGSTPNDKYAYKNHKFFPDAEELFGQFDYEVTGSRSADGFIIFQIEVPKNRISIKDIENLESKITDRGWYYNYDKQKHFWSFCKKDKYESIRIYYPSGNPISKRNGDYLRNDLDKNVVHVWFKKDSSAEDYKEFAECE